MWQIVFIAFTLAILISVLIASSLRNYDEINYYDELSKDKEKLFILKRYTEILDSKHTQNVITDRDYNNELRFINNELQKLELKYGVEDE